MPNALIRSYPNWDCRQTGREGNNRRRAAWLLREQREKKREKGDAGEKYGLLPVLKLTMSDAADAAKPYRGPDTARAKPLSDPAIQSREISTYHVIYPHSFSFRLSSCLLQLLGTIKAYCLRRISVLEDY